MKFKTWQSQTALLLSLFLAGIFISACSPKQADSGDEPAETQVLLDKWLEMWNTGNTDLITEVITEDFVRTDPDHPNGTFKGADTYKEFLTSVRATWPDFNAVINDYIRKGNIVFLAFTMKGTNTGPLSEEVPATDKAAQTDGMAKFEITDGRISREWTVWDRLGVDLQLGFQLIPPQAEMEKAGGEGDTK